ncbi:XRE family transcriptional regulator [Actinomadura harenae]|uniref:XRE family transcriptional regulator n=2 Tax=Actinomadura harenae TaxID=2483351 RepID=A0A3M2M515_9ACTN|nr:XRE family transcriptional regulator [Actinomadura harenae]
MSKEAAMTTRQSPTLRRRRLSALLKTYRGDAFTTVEVDRRLGWTVGKVAKMERGVWSRPNLRDMEDLLNLYAVDDQRQRQEVLTLARQGRERGWWHPYREMISESYTTYIGLEAEAASVLQFEALMVPGLLQTQEYAYALLRRGPSELDDESVKNRVEIRMERQKALKASDPLRLWAIVDEAVLWRPVGDATVMAAQLRHMIRLSELPKVTIQVAPFAAGAHAGMGGPFTMLEFPEPQDPDAVYTETITGELLEEDDVDVAKVKVAFQRLTGDALSAQASLDLIDARARVFEAQAS